MAKQIIIDGTTTQDQLKNSGIGKYTKNIIKNIIKIAPPTLKISILLFDGPSTLDTADLKNAQIIRCGKLRLNNYLNYYWYRTQMLPVIKKHATKDTSYFCPYFWRYYPVKQMPTIVMIHDMALAQFNIYAGKPGIFNAIRKYQYWHALNPVKHTTKILANSQFTKDEFLRYFPNISTDKVAVTLLGVEEELYSYDKSAYIVDKYLPSDWKNKGYFINMGSSTNSNKNTLGLIEAYQEFLKKRETNNAPYLVIAGKDFVKQTKNADMIHEKIFKLGLRKQIIFTGFYEDSESASLMANSIAFMHLSLYEGFGFAVADAMACGAPVIAHNGSSYTEVVGLDECLVDGNNPVEVANKMELFFKDRKLAKEIGEKLKARASKFDWEETARLTLHNIV